ncbi:LexA family transcriptional regulator [Pseudomonas sp. ML96]|uniref:LexA family protein n=1 Tax=Pseudomonas sp. ML96 TaxID=1523503 RepID=UPI00068E2B8E|nr:S24 family peptidase [Pseudomonas sp. ML96]
MAISGQLIGRLLTEKLKELGLNETELARRAGVAQPTAHRILGGESSNPRIDNVNKLARALGLDAAALLAGKLQADFDENVIAGPDIKGRVPRISWVQAGALSEAIDLFEPGYAEDWLDCPFPHSTGAFCLEVRGNSMFPDYRPGELILVEPKVDATHDDDIVARTPDGQATFKRLQITEDGTYLLALNPDFPNRIITVPEGTEICGVVTGSWMNRRRKSI